MKKMKVAIPFLVGAALLASSSGAWANWKGLTTGKIYATLQECFDGPNGGCIVAARVKPNGGSTKADGTPMATNRTAPGRGTPRAVSDLTHGCLDSHGIVTQPPCIGTIDIWTKLYDEAD